MLLVFVCLCQYLPIPMMRLNLKGQKACLGFVNFNFSKQIVMDHQWFDFICHDNALKREKHRETCENYVCHIVSFELRESAFNVLSTLFFMCDQFYVMHLQNLLNIFRNFVSYLCILEMTQAIRNPPWPNEHVSQKKKITLRLPFEPIYQPFNSLHHKCLPLT